jgi:prolyl 4-hydroxylase
VAYNDEDYYHTASWMSEAMNKLEKEENKTMNKSDIIDYLSFALYQVNIQTHALAPVLFKQLF